MSADVWRRIPMSTLSSSFSSLVMSRLVPHPTRSSLTSIILARSLSLLYSLMLMLTTAHRLICNTHLFDVLGAQPFNYTDAIDSLPNAVHAFGGPRALKGTNAFITAMVSSRMLVRMMPTQVVIPRHGRILHQTLPMILDDSNVSDAGTFVLYETSA